MTQLTTFADRLKALRLKASLTVRELAEKSGVERTYLYALEAGRKAAPPWDTVVALAKALGAKTDAFRE